MLLRLEHTIKTTFIPLVQKQLVTVQTLTTKILTVVLRILKAFGDLLLSIPQRIFNRNMQLKPSISITSFPNQDGMVLDQDLLSLALTYVADPRLEGVSKGVAKASLQSYRLIFEELEKEPQEFLSLLVKQTIIDYPIKNDEAIEEVFKKRLIQVYCTSMANAKNWPGHAETFFATKSYGPLSSKRLAEIAQWTTDQHLIHFFNSIVQHNPRTRQYLSILNPTLSVKEKAYALRQWLRAHPCAFDNLNSLYLTGLDKFKLTEIPPEIGYLKNLENFFVADNAIQFLPDAIGQLKQLKTLSLFRNQLQRLPDSIGQLTQLQELELAHNQFKELPDSIRQLTQLKKLDLTENQIKELPNFFGHLTQLKKLYLGRNQLQRLPDSIGQLAKLKTLCLGSNQFKELPLCIKQLTRLQMADLWNEYNLVYATAIRN